MASGLGEMIGVFEKKIRAVRGKDYGVVSRVVSCHGSVETYGVVAAAGSTVCFLPL
jgi:hypothetical protein